MPEPSPRPSRLLAAALLAVLLAACSGVPGTSATPSGEAGSPTPPVEVTPTPVPQGSGAADLVKALDLAEARWRETNASAYVFEFTRQCFCPEEWRGPFRVEVGEGGVTVTRGGAPVAAQILGSVPTAAEALFATLREHVADKDYRASFDEATGFPLSFWSDPIPMAADDEQGFDAVFLGVTP